LPARWKKPSGTRRDEPRPAWGSVATAANLQTDGGGERTIFRLAARAGTEAGVYEVEHDGTTGSWRLRRVVD
jgi:hypothetical protein